MSHLKKISYNFPDAWKFLYTFGLLNVLLAVWSLFNTHLDSNILDMIFSTVFFVGGIVEIYVALSLCNKVNSWILQLVLGITSMIIGGLLLFKIDYAHIILTSYIGFISLFRFTIGMGMAITLSHTFKDWVYMLLIAILGVLFSIFLLANPESAALALSYWVAISIIVYGVFIAFFALLLKDIKQ